MKNVPYARQYCPLNVLMFGCVMSVLAPQNIPRAICILTLGNKVVWYSIVVYALTHDE